MTSIETNSCNPFDFNFDNFTPWSKGTQKVTCRLQFPKGHPYGVDARTFTWNPNKVS